MLKKLFWILLIFYLCAETPFAREHFYPYYKKIGKFFHELSETGSPPPRGKLIPYPYPAPPSVKKSPVTQQTAAQPSQHPAIQITPPNFSQNYKGEYEGKGGSTRH